MLIWTLPQEVKASLGVIAGILLVVASLSYISSILTKDIAKRITPRPLSWIGWFLMVGVSLLSQVMTSGLKWSQTALFATTFFCILIPVLSFLLKRYLVKPMDWFCLVLGLVCFATYLFTKDAVLTTVTSLVADFIVAIPTFHNAFIDPKSEKTSAWRYGVASWLLTLIACIDGTWLYALFPIYLFLFNTTMIVLTSRKSS